MSKLATQESGQQFLTFCLQQDTYAVDTDFVREISEFRTVTQVPLMPDFVFGVYNLRGEVVPVIDLAVRFGRGKTEISRQSCLLVLDIPFEGGIATLGVLVDRVEDVLEIAASDIEPAPSFGAKLHSHFIRGVARIADQLVILLKAEQVLSIDEMSSLIKHMNQ